MGLIIHHRTQLGPQQIAHLSSRVAAPEHSNDNGPCKAWDQPACESMLYAVVIASSSTPIGILYANFIQSGLEVGWWIDKPWREKKLTRRAIISFANLLRAEHLHYSGQVFAAIKTFAGTKDGASSALLEDFKRHFVKENSRTVSS
ncbi:MAG: hypothetical protein NTV11_17455 [Rhodocyclales bacterium]|nr:hypothetical protein [Rhodocyclales bacterium]